MSKHCPHCKTEIENQPTKCPFCRGNIAWGPRTAKGQAIESEISKSFVLVGLIGVPFTAWYKDWDLPWWGLILLSAFCAGLGFALPQFFHEPRKD